ncbi:MAG: indolepyruvate oxidoreductase subunit beta [Deltaproteobacteria bacterium]|nr:MAG: indolepyruvate oxidoreductase subunit beta [Deltaproteobacteria bacterium]
MKSEITSVLLVGVGGQGVLLASEITARAALAVGYTVKTNEVHGMAQRGGSVTAHVRYGEEVFSPLVPMGEASVLGSLEEVEPIRYHNLLKPGGLAVVSAQRIIPTTVSTGQATYPADAKDRLKRVFPNLVYFDAVEEARSLGNPQAANLVILGAMSTALTLPADAWKESIGACVKPKFLELNLRAFARGRELA